MKQYNYIGRNNLGNKVNGIIETDSDQEALLMLKEEGIAVIQLKEQKMKWLNREIHLDSRIKMRELIIFLRQFATLLDAGVSVARSIKILADQTESRMLKNAIESVGVGIQAGNSLSEAASRQRKVFPQIMITMLHAGEVSGNLDETLMRLGDYFERQYDLRQKVISALIYPIILSFVAFFVIVFMLTFVVPTFVTMYEGMDKELPFITQTVLNVSSWMTSNLIIVILIIVTLGVLLYFLARNKSIKYYLEYVIFKMPIYGEFLQKTTIARLTRTLSSLVASSVPILQAMEIVEKVIDNQVMNRVVRQSRGSLESGQSITVPLKHHWLFPPLVTQMLAIGEETGSLDSMLLKVAEFYESDVEHMTDRLKSLIEPLLIIFIAAIIGGIVLSIVVPLFDIYQNVNSY
jgi:type IV pilus assembly protein PilC